MSLRKGKFKLSVYRITSGHLDYERILTDAQKLAAPPLGNTGRDVQAGFASGAVLLNTEINADNSIFDGWLMLNLRKAQLKVNSGLLKATIQRDEQVYMKANSMEFVPSKVRREIKEEAMEKLMPHAKLAVSGTEFAIKDDTLYIASQSERECDEVIIYLAKLGIQAKRECAYSKMARMIDGDNKADFKVGRAFLTWLFKQLNVDGKSEEWFMEGPLDFIADSGRCTQAALRGDCVIGSYEVLSFVEQEKLIRKAKLMLALSMEFRWRCGFDADNWSFGSMELPDSESFNERMELLAKFLKALDDCFTKFAITYEPTKTTEE